MTTSLDEPFASDVASLPVAFVNAGAPPAPTAISNSPLVLWSVGGAALLLTMGLGIGFWMSGGAPLGDRMQPAVAAAAEIVETPTAPERHEAMRAVDDAEEVGVRTATEPEEELTAVTAPQQPRELPQLPPAEQNAEGQESSATIAPPHDDAEQAAPASQPSDAVQHAPVLRIDPFDFDPNRLSLGSGGTATAVEPASIPGGAAGDAEVPIEESGDDAAVELAAPAVEQQTLHVQRGPMAGPGAADKRIDERLDTTLQSFAVSEMPLQRFVEVLSDIAAVPITMDPLALELAGVSPQRPVTIQATDAALSAILREGLAKTRLDFVEDAGRLIMVLRGGEAWRSVNHEVDDLAASGDANVVAELIDRFVAPETWQASGGKGTVAVEDNTLKVEQSVSVHHEILLFLERLRLTRGLPTRSRYPAALLSIEPAGVALAPKLREPITFTFLPWVRLNDVVRHWQEVSGITILVDWRALADLELGPESPVACVAIDRTREETLDGILEPLGLAWWAVNGDTIQITTRDATDAMRRVEFYEVPAAMQDQVADDTALVDSLRAKVSERDHGAVKHLRIERDDTSSRLIVLGPPAAHRILAQLLFMTDQN